MSEESRHADQLEVIRRFSAGLRVRDDLQGTLDNLARHTVEATRAEGAVVSIVDPSLGLTRVGTCRIPKFFSSYARDIFLREQDTPLHRALQNSDCIMLHLDNIPDVFWETPLPGYLREQGWDKGLLAPLCRREERPLGLLHGFFPTHVAPSEEERLIHETLASIAVVAIENALLFEKVEEQAVHTERLRLGRELHDSVSQTLFSIGLGAEAALETVRTEPEATVKSLDYILKLARSSLDEMRTLLFKLRPERLEDSGLVKALRDTLETLRHRYGLTVESDLQDQEPDLSAEVKYTLFRIATEALHNSVKHSRARRIKLSLQSKKSTVSLTIEDNGVGFPLESPPASGHGFQIMRERSQNLGGDFTVHSEPGQGTRVSVVLKRRFS